MSSLPDPSVLIGSAGVGLLLIAFFASLFGRMDPRGSTYAALNAIGAAMSCAASAMIHYVPFVVLEATWSVVAIVGLIRSLRARR